MFVRKTTHTNNKNAQTYFTYKLVESVRTERGPRQRTVLNLGSDFNTPQEQWKQLADRIEQIVSGQTCLFPVPGEIEQAARRHARQIIQYLFRRKRQVQSQGAFRHFQGKAKRLSAGNPCVADGYRRVPEGNVSEPGTLSKILPAISTTTRKPVVVTDAGIGTQENVQWLTANGYAYVVVSRKRGLELPAGMEMLLVRQDDHRIIRAGIRENASGEVDVYCHSTAKEIKERGIKNRFEQRFEEKLTDVRKSLHKKHGTKKYEKVLEKIGRLKERYRRVARRYEVRVEKDDTSANAKDVVWKRWCIFGKPPSRKNAMSGFITRSAFLSALARPAK